MRAPAKRYLRSLPDHGLPPSITEPECVSLLIRMDVQRRRRLEDCHRPASLSWFGRLLWKMFGRWP